MNIIRDLLWLLFVNIKYDTVQHVGSVLDWYRSYLTVKDYFVSISREFLFRKTKYVV